MLSSCGSRLLSGGGGSSSSSSGASSSSGGRHASQVELLVGASTSSNSSEPLESGGQLNHWHQHKQDDEFITVNGAIFTLSNNQKQRQTATASYLNLAHNNSTRRHETATLIHHQPGPPAETKSSRLEQHNSIGQPRPLNRQHQYRPIHQQLQRIYGNKLQEFEQISRQQRQATQTVQSSGNNKRDSSSQVPPPPPPINMQTKQMEHVLSLDCHPHQRHHHQHSRLHSNHLDESSVGYHQPGSQTYDSLVVTEQAMPTQPQLNMMTNKASFNQSRQMAPQELHQTYQQNLYDFNPRPLIKVSPIRSERPGRAPIESEYDANNNVMMQTTETKEFGMENEEEEEQIVLEDENEEQGLLEDARQIARQSSKLLIDSRKRQMESLHYATATAAALLNVTASAAAAFAVSDKNLAESARNQQQQPRPRVPTQLTERRLQAAPMANMTTGAKLSNGQNIRHGDQYRQLYGFGSDYVKQSAPPQQRRPHNNFRNQMQQSRPPVRDQQQAVYQIDADQNGIRNQQHQNRSGVTNFNYNQQQQLSAMVRPPQPVRQQVGARLSGGPMTQQQLELLRRYRQQMQLPGGASQISASRPSYGANLYNNIQQVRPASLALAANAVPTMAMLQARDKLVKHNQQQQLVAAAAANSFDPRLLMLTSGQLQNGNALAKLQNELKQRQQQVAYGLLVPAKNGEKQPVYAPVPLQLKGQFKQQAVARQSHYQLGAITSNSSETSGRSNVPLILNRAVVKPAKSSLIDKISHINLTIFWWILLVICVIFITAVITITRYLT